MKIFINDLDNLVLEIDEIDKKILSYDIPSITLEEDIKRRISFFIGNRINEAMEVMIKEWKETIDSRYDSVPTSPKAYAELITSQFDYQDKIAYDAGQQKIREWSNLLKYLVDNTPTDEFEALVLIEEIENLIPKYSEAIKKQFKTLKEKYPEWLGAQNAGFLKAEDLLNDREATIQVIFKEYKPELSDMATLIQLRNKVFIESQPENEDK